MRGNALWLEQVLSNLLSNAVKHSPEATSVRMEIRETQGKVQLAVSDEGTGVPEDQQNQLFQKFSSISNQKKEGTGLGLYIVQHMIQRMGGRVFLDTDYQKGARFVTELSAEAA